MEWDAGCARIGSESLLLTADSKFHAVVAIEQDLYLALQRYPVYFLLKSPILLFVTLSSQILAQFQCFIQFLNQQLQYGKLHLIFDLLVAIVDPFSSQFSVAVSVFSRFAQRRNFQVQLTQMVKSFRNYYLIFQIRFCTDF